MQFHISPFTIPNTGEKGLYACMFVFSGTGQPELFQNWGPEGMSKEKFVAITSEKFNKMLVAVGLPVDMEYDDWKSCAPLPGRGA